MNAALLIFIICMIFSLIMLFGMIAQKAAKTSLSAGWYLFDRRFQHLNKMGFHKLKVDWRSGFPVQEPCNDASKAIYKRRLSFFKWEDVILDKIDTKVNRSMDVNIIETGLRSYLREFVNERRQSAQRILFLENELAEAKFNETNAISSLDNHADKVLRRTAQHNRDIFISQTKGGRDTGKFKQ